jgi:hypothetical protein
MLSLCYTVWNSYVQAAKVSQRRTAVSSKCFQLHYTCSDSSPSCSPVVFPSFFRSYSDVSEARSYFAYTIRSEVKVRSKAQGGGKMRRKKEGTPAVKRKRD